jgi:hypothetical protein
VVKLWNVRWYEMKRIYVCLFVCLFVFCWALPAMAVPAVDLQEWGFNVNGTIIDNLNGDAVTDLPAYVNYSGFDFNTGLGTVTVTFSAPGTYAIAVMFDHEMNQTINGFMDEYASQTGFRVTGQSFQMETPLDVYDYFSAFNAITPLENAVEFGPAQDGSGNPIQDPNDQSMALGQIFDLVAGQTGVLTFTVDRAAPASGMYLQQFDQGFQGTGLPGDPSADPGSIYFSSNLTVRNESVPEPSTLVLVLEGLAFVIIGKKRLFRKRGAP